MLENFAVLHSTGECLFLRNYDGEALDVKVVSGLASYVTLLGSAIRPSASQGEKESMGTSEGKSTTQNSEIIAVQAHRRRFACLPTGPCLLIAQGTESDSDELLTIYLRAVEELLHYYLGDFLLSKSSQSDIQDVMDIVHSYLSKMQSDPTYLVGGSHWIFLDSEARQAADRLLAGLEESDAILGSAMLLGESILHARLPAIDIRMMQHHLTARPLKGAGIRTVPVYSEGQWKHMVLYRIHHLLLVVYARIRVSFSVLNPLVEDFEEYLEEALTYFPIEEPPVLLRHYTGHDTLAFLYQDTINGACICPPPRPGPRTEQTRTIQALAGFFGLAWPMVADGIAKQVTFTVDGFQFHAEITPSYRIFLLTSDRLSVGNLRDTIKEVTANIQQHMGDMGTEQIN